MKKPKSSEKSTAAAEANSTHANSAEPNSAESTDSSAPTRSAAFTPKKGKPTPKRNEVERQAGVRRTSFEAPTTPAEARKRRKELKQSMSKEEYKAMKQRQRDEAARERRKANERMMAGDEKYLMERDKGREKRLVRDFIDSRRFIMNIFLPLTLVVVLVMLVGTRNPQIANLASLVMMAIFLILLLEGIWVGRRVNRLVNERYPDNPFGKFHLGMYAFTRATMLRRFRTPAPQKNIGDSV
ncbi:DUF3043 domain-containing protein [Corynebacterium sp. 320]|uniref:DUF3043 domain-containing protein n=1 Tax=Corynebacterium zhongnanshanii TaxID=2768834 RepID=A0ABQ6VDU2_9CORY|nr:MULTISPECIES: DUF3043 domain-containing protein [Corynebacterium]KAB1502471.1 DUF3043 domain-containing protein [Corynebacterium sp. 320]KAB1551308.1 DUF3043 domain-containing protein [Corynebacterium sp. 321]KAB1551864.1 DUF3043 domain-containing protein [Corynebacterium sp. 319]KAB3520847.1 DUF3043 domain-containing protein [Corynebacterium zhongnanshanii]KAB3526078.1 DUF3043 domain-containing protein [Corynebacterium sp. 250]